MKNQQMKVAILIIAVGAAAFFGGMKYQENRQPKMSGGTNQLRQFQGTGRQPGGSARFGNNGLSRPVTGQIISQDDKSITVKLSDGSSKIVLLPDSMIVSKTSTGSKADLKTGETVGVFGTENPDGSVTAQNIQLNPMFRLGQSRGASQSSPSANNR